MDNSGVPRHTMSMSMSIKIISVAKIAKLLRRPRGRSVIKVQCQEKTGEKEMFSDVDKRQIEKKMLGCRMAMRFLGFQNMVRESVEDQGSPGVICCQRTCKISRSNPIADGQSLWKSCIAILLPKGKH